MKTLYNILLKPIFLIISGVFIGLFQSLGSIISGLLAVLIKTALLYWIYGLLIKAPEIAALGLPSLKFWTIMLIVIITNLLANTSTVKSGGHKEKISDEDNEDDIKNIKRTRPLVPEKK